MSVPEWVMANGDSLQLMLFFGMFGVLALLERVRPRRVGALERRERWPTNLGLTLLNFVVLSFQPISFVTVASWAEQRGLGLLNSLSLPASLLVVAALLARGFVSFATHWLMHKLPLLWRLHRVHHLDTELDVTSTVRVHPLEFLIGTLSGIPLIVAFGPAPWVLVIYEVLDAAVTVLSHANLRLPEGLERVLHYVIVTPDLHRVHHSTWQPETDSNFGAVFPIWDIVFGTFRSEPRDGHERMRLGLDEERGPRARQLGLLLASPLRQRL